MIRAWLWHAGLETTNRCAEITLRTKQAALESAACPRAEKREFREHLNGRATQPCCVGCNRCERDVPLPTRPQAGLGSAGRSATERGRITWVAFPEVIQQVGLGGNARYSPTMTPPLFANMHS